MSPADSDADFPSDLRALEREYELIRELGHGGMAAVYLARRRDDGRLVAIKAIRARYLDDADALQRFTREATTVAGLDHPNIVRTESIEQIDDRAVAIIMQHVPGGTVRDWLREHGSLGAEHAESILRDVASALGYAHRHGIVHRDVKPENVFLDAQHGRALLSDFGIARRIDGDAGITLLGAALGTPQYMSPEQIDGQLVDGRSDIYSLGVLGWELLTGRRPWAGESLYGVIYKQKHEDLPRITSLRPRVPANLLFAIERALIKDKKLRWQNTDEFLDQLTYNPPPVLAQTYPGRQTRADDQPTVRFRRLSLVQDDASAVGGDADEIDSLALADASETTATVRTTSAHLPVAQFTAPDEPLRRSGEHATEVAAVAAMDFTLPSFEPNADPAFEFPSRRAQVFRALGLVLPLGIAAAALFIVLSGSPDDPASRAPGTSAVTSSDGSVVSDALHPQPVPSSPHPGGTLAAKPSGADAGIVEGSGAPAPRHELVKPPSAQQGRPPFSSTRRGASSTAAAPAAVSAPSQPRLERNGTLAPAPQYPVGVVDGRRPAAKDDSTPSPPPSSKASTDPVLEDPFKIPPSSGAPALGLAGSEPSPRCRIGAAADQRVCLDAYVAAGDAPLTQAFEALVAELRRRAGAPPGAVDPPTVQRVRVEQRAWLSVRNGECPRSPAAGAGPFWAQERSECFTEMAAARTAELRDAVRRLRRK